MFKSNLLKAIYVSSLVLFLVSCSAVNNKVEEVLELDSDFKLSFVVADDLNPDDSRVPSPVIIRMYELQDVKAFKKSNFIDLYERDIEILGESMLTRQMLKPIKPGQQSQSDFVLSKETRFVGLYVEFLQYENAKYKLTIPVEKNIKANAFAKVQLSGNTISLLK